MIGNNLTRGVFSICSPARLYIISTTPKRFQSYRPSSLHFSVSSVVGRPSRLSLSHFAQPFPVHISQPSIGPRSLIGTSPNSPHGIQIGETCAPTGPDTGFEETLRVRVQVVPSRLRMASFRGTRFVMVCIPPWNKPHPTHIQGYGNRTFENTANVQLYRLQPPTGKIPSSCHEEYNYERLPVLPPGITKADSIFGYFQYGEHAPVAPYIRKYDTSLPVEIFQEISAWPDRHVDLRGQSQSKPFQSALSASACATSQSSSVSPLTNSRSFTASVAPPSAVLVFTRWDRAVRQVSSSRPFTHPITERIWTFDGVPGSCTRSRSQVPGSPVSSISVHSVPGWSRRIHALGMLHKTKAPFDCGVFNLTDRFVTNSPTPEPQQMESSWAFGKSLRARYFLRATPGWSLRTAHSRHSKRLRNQSETRFVATDETLDLRC